ncbi:MAG: hypothetical protein BGO67_06140 [Alphaproteobacteria bacterium 41-28]|nr:MAG: hypothetical protein BGO67_06140 [Alphaproteobacteria bacterium 41-28]
MCYKSKFLMGFSLTCLFISASFPVQAMDKEDPENGTPKRGKSISEHMRMRKNLQNKDAVLKGEYTRDAIKELKESKVQVNLNREKLIEKLREVITGKEKKEITIYSKDVSPIFVSELFTSWINRSEGKLTLSIYTTPTGMEMFNEGIKERKFKRKHTIKIEALDSSFFADINILIAGQTLFVSTTYPWLTLPSAEIESILYSTTMISGERAEEEITKTKEELKKARQNHLRNMKNCSLTAARMDESMGRESSDSDEEHSEKLAPKGL